MEEAELGDGLGNWHKALRGELSAWYPVRDLPCICVHYPPPALARGTPPHLCRWLCGRGLAVAWQDPCTVTGRPARGPSTRDRWPLEPRGALAFPHMCQGQVQQLVSERHRTLLPHPLTSIFNSPIHYSLSGRLWEPIEELSFHLEAPAALTCGLGCGSVQAAVSAGSAAHRLCPGLSAQEAPEAVSRSCGRGSRLTILQRGHRLSLHTEVTVPDVVGGFQAQLVRGEGPQPETQRSP